MLKRFSHKCCQHYLRVCANGFQHWKHFGVERHALCVHFENLNQSVCRPIQNWGAVPPVIHVHKLCNCQVLKDLAKTCAARLVDVSVHPDALHGMEMQLWSSISASPRIQYISRKSRYVETPGCFLCSKRRRNEHCLVDLSPRGCPRLDPSAYTSRSEWARCLACAKMDLRHRMRVERLRWDILKPIKSDLETFVWASWIGLQRTHGHVRRFLEKRFSWRRF